MSITPFFPNYCFKQFYQMLCQVIINIWWLWNLFTWNQVIQLINVVTSIVYLLIAYFVVKNWCLFDVFCSHFKCSCLYISIFKISLHCINCYYLYFHLVILILIFPLVRFHFVALTFISFDQKWFYLIMSLNLVLRYDTSN